MIIVTWYCKRRLKWRLKGKIKRPIYYAQSSDLALCRSGSFFYKIGYVIIGSYNPTYYELHELPLPQEQPLKKAGPVSKGKKAVGAKATASDSIYSFGYSLAVLKIAKDLGLSATLKENFSDDEVNTLLAVGSYFGAGTPYGSGNFDYYIQKNPCFNSKLITSQRLSELYEELNEERTRFFF